MKEILDIFGVDTRLLLLQVFNFSILLLALWYFLYRPVILMLERRRFLIEKGVNDARAAEEERKNVENEKGDILASASEEAENIVNHAVLKGKEAETVLIKEMEEYRVRTLKEADVEAREERKKIIDSGREEIAQMVVLGVEKILQEKSGVNR